MAALQQENQQLREQIANLTHERDLWRHQAQDETTLPGSSQAIHPFLTGPVVLFIWAAQEGWPVEYVSPNITRFGYTADDFLKGRVPYPSVVYPDDLERVAEEVAQYSAEGYSTFEQDYRIVTAAGETRWIYDYTTVIRDSAGTVTHYIGYILDITERKRMEEELHLFKALADNALDGVAMASMDSKLTYANAAFQTMSGRGENAHGMSVTELYPPEVLAYIEQHVAPVLITEGFWQGTLEIARPDDSRWLAQNSLFTIYDKEGKPIKTANIVRDITEQKRQEEELRESEGWFRDLTSSLFDGLAMFEQGYLIETNDKFARMLGYEVDEMLGMWVLDIIAPESKELVRKNALSGYEEPYEAMMLRKDGSTFAAEILGKEHTYKGKDVRVSTVRDITERKQQESELRRYAAIIEQTTDGVSMSDAQANVQMVNLAFRRMVGMSPDEDVTAYRIADFHPDWALQYVQNEGIPAAISEGVWLGESALLNHATGQETPISQVIIAHKTADGDLDFFSTIVRDLSERKRQEAEREALQQQIIDAQRETLRELSTPLIPITDTVMIMPLIGTIDSQRAQMVMEALLEGVAQHQAELVILDITGVSVVDTQVAQAFVQAAQAVRLLGAQVMLTGIGPQIAQTLVHLGVDLSSMRTQGSLQSGIAAALKGNVSHT
jgi:rsbT co-antagonist protein RsbR